MSYIVRELHLFHQNYCGDFISSAPCVTLAVCLLHLELLLPPLENVKSNNSGYKKKEKGEK
jgi:hypothetical protein